MSARTDSLKLRLEGIAWLVAWRITRLLPERWAYAAFERLSMRSYERNARRRAAVEANLEPIVGPARLQEAVRESFRWYGRYWAETFRMEDLTDEELDERFGTEGIEHIQNAYDAGRGGVLATCHIGNWDSGGRWVAKRWPLVAVAEVLRPRMLFFRFLEHRRALGLEIIPLERGEDVTGRCLSELALGKLVALVADRDLSRSGIEVKMFGRRTKLPPGPAVLALRSGAPLIPACIYQREDGTWFAHVMAPLPIEDPASPEAVPALTQRLATSFEELIGAHPEQWHVYSPYWIDR